MTTDGRQHAIYEQVDAEGKRVRGESTYRLDGRDAPITGNPELDSQAITRTGPRSISAVVKKGGRTLRTATREVSADGKTMTLQFKGVNAKGQPLDDTWVFERTPSLPARDEAVRAAIDQGIKALVARDWGNFSLYSDDAVMSPPNTTPKIGRAAIIEWNKSLAASAPVKEYRHEPTEIIGSGDFAFVRGRYTIVSQPENAPAITNTGSYFEVWRRQATGTARCTTAG